jgi:hypothetical protein
LGWEVTICGAEARDKVSLEGLDGTFRGIDAVFVGWNELPFDVFASEVFCDGLGSFIVEDIKLGFETF